MTSVNIGPPLNGEPGIFKHRIMGSTLVVSFPRETRVLSWAILNGGIRPNVKHIINHHVEGSTLKSEPATTLRQVVSRLGLKGTVVGMMTAADVRHYSMARASHKDLVAYSIATAGCTNLATVGEEGKYLDHRAEAICGDTINLIVVANYRFTHEAMLEAIEIATEAKVKAMYEFGLRSKATGEPATGTGTDCVAVAVGHDRRYLFCGKHTKWGELLGRAALESLRTALRATSPGNPNRKENTNAAPDCQA